MMSRYVNRQQHISIGITQILVFVTQFFGTNGILLPISFISSYDGGIVDNEGK